MTEQTTTKQSTLTQDLRELTDKSMHSISQDMSKPDAMFKNARHYKDIAATLEKFANVIAKVSKLSQDEEPEQGYVDNSTVREQREIIEGAYNFYDGQRERVIDSLKYLRKREAEEAAADLEEEIENKKLEERFRLQEQQELERLAREEYEEEQNKEEVDDDIEEDIVEEETEEVEEEVQKPKKPTWYETYGRIRRL
jgi:hypothetical protein